MQSQAVAKTLVVLLAVCCLVPLTALAAVIYLAAPVWLVTLVGLVALALLGWRLMILLAVNDKAGFPPNLPNQPGLWASTASPKTRLKADSEILPGGSDESRAQFPNWKHTPPLDHDRMLLDPCHRVDDDLPASHPGGAGHRH